MPYDLFISYSRCDNAQGRITQLVERIQHDFAAFEGNNGRELVPFFDQQEIHGMPDWRQRILQGLRESRLLLACLADEYGGGRWQVRCAGKDDLRLALAELATPARTNYLTPQNSIILEPKSPLRLFRG